MKLGMKAVLGPRHIVLDGDPAPSTKGPHPPIFGSCLLWVNGWMDQDHIVLHDPSPPKGTQRPTISAHVCCGQTAGWIKMPLGTEVGLGPGDIVLDWYPAPPKRGTASPLFGPCLLWPNGGPSQPVLSCCRIGYGESVRYFGYGSVTSNTAVATTREVQLFNFKIV